jgi:hypothetical protein
MTDWKAVAHAVGLDLNEADLARVVAPLTALEPVFQKIAGTLTPDAEPATIYEPAPEDPEE